MIKQFLALLAFSCLPTLAFAGDSSESEPAVTVGGTFKLDQVQFQEKNAPKASDQRFYNSAYPALMSLSVSAKYSPTLSFYTDFDLNRSPALGLAYLQIKDLFGENSSLMLGQVPSPFCLEHANSGKWIPFMYRSLAVSAFSPCIGPGANIRVWRQHWVLNLAGRQLAYGEKTSSPEDDRWGASARLIFKPLVHDEKLVHFGGSITYQAQKDELVFKSSEMKARVNPELITTKTAANTIMAKDYYVLGGEAAARLSALEVEGDYLKTTVRRSGLTTLNFSGWSAQANYFLTGEIREYKEDTGSFGGPKSIHNSQLGAWQVAYRASELDLNSGDTAHGIRGGRQFDHSAALNWYPSDYLKFTANYIYAQIWPHDDAAKRQVHMLGLRLQASF
jgi:phosphate-selective porin OprO/OprP